MSHRRWKMLRSRFVSVSSDHLVLLFVLAHKEALEALALAPHRARSIHHKQKLSCHRTYRVLTAEDKNMYMYGLRNRDRSPCLPSFHWLLQRVVAQNIAIPTSSFRREDTVGEEKEVGSQNHSDPHPEAWAENNGGHLATGVLVFLVGALDHEDHGE